MSDGAGRLIIPSNRNDEPLVCSPSGKKTRTLTVETWKKIMRLMGQVKAEGFSARFVCDTCREPIHMTVPSKTSPRLECRCTCWMGQIK